MKKDDDTVEKIKEEKIEESKNESCNCEECDCKDTDSEKLNEELVEAENKYKRALADYQNLQKRTQDERRDWIQSAGRDILLRMLPVLDTLALASKHVDDQGVKVTLQQFFDVFKSEGVVKIEALGKKFDPHIMECIDKEDEGDDVIEEVREGYMLNDKLLRVAQVKVGKK